MSYRTFLRSCTDWKSFAKARKITQATGLTEAEAYKMCQEYNASRTPRQIAKGTKMEYTCE
jgi:hypothetical protein